MTDALFLLSIFHLGPFPSLGFLRPVSVDALSLLANTLRRFLGRPVRLVHPSSPPNISEVTGAL
jgi:hypothetical protein